MALRIKNIFKRTEDDDMSPCMMCLTKTVEVPLNLMRDFTCPMADFAEWDRNRASILPMTIPTGFCILWEFLFDPDTRHTYGMVCLYALIPGVMLAIYIRCRTTRTRPPPTLMFIYAVCAFFMSISWISFTSDVVVDLLDILGMVIGVPAAVLGFSLLAWGNCLGDLNADVAMTKKGFGEMAITGCMAGPIFNLNAGLGLPMLLVFLENPQYDKISWTIIDPKDGSFNVKNLVPVALICACIFVYIWILLNGCKNDYSLTTTFHQPMLFFYGIVVLGLVIFAVIVY